MESTSLEHNRSIEEPNVGDPAGPSIKTLLDSVDSLESRLESLEAGMVRSACLVLAAYPEGCDGERIRVEFEETSHSSSSSTLASPK